ncbi:redoxin family protein [Actinocrispum sp. NPDC049592]|uniref:redoxin family protein n=1 Tax=Actinocrispum sp. NPDC049592 TaxID=3154835 RepID=UPI00344699BE
MAMSRRAVLAGAVALGLGGVAAAVVPWSAKGDVMAFDSVEWANTPPGDLRGRVVLVNFWTLTCINWLRTAPYVRAWAQTYRADGLTVIGVHTPEFTFEHSASLVRSAIAARGIDYPVAIDNDYKIWRSFDNHYWPALYFLDRSGKVVGHQFGEGDYASAERRIQELLGVTRTLVPVTGEGVEASADWAQLRSGETYLGSSRGDTSASLEGSWAVEPERVVVRSAGARLAYRFHARDAHLVLSQGTDGPIPFRVTLDGQAPGAAHGGDVDAAGNGVLNEGRLYQLIRSPGQVSDRTVEITFDKPGAEAYAFTFG